MAEITDEDRRFFDAYTPNRPRDRVASLPEIAAYWASNPDVEDLLPAIRAHWIGFGEPFCFACGWLAPVLDDENAWKRAAGWLERAHLVDHCFGGSGEPENLVPLCFFCHEAMRPYSFLDRIEALGWVTGHQTNIPMFEYWQIFTDEMARVGGGGSGSRQTRMYRLRGDYLMLYAKLAAEIAAEGRALPGPRPKRSLREPYPCDPGSK
jgi:hypothetical protein